MTDIDAILRHVDANLTRSTEDFLRLLSMPSVSAAPKGSRGIADCAEWLAAELSAIGLIAEVIETEGHPVVLARHQAPAGPSVLLYGHYDVQPPEPLEDWATPPFEPSIRNEDGLTRIYARGASDSKGQLWSVIEALHAIKEVQGTFPCSITVMLEGEEETGSAGLADFIARHRHRLDCDVAFISDSDMWSRTRPAIATRLKGLIHEKVTISALNPDLHSGHYGNVAANPVRILTSILSDLHGADGRIDIPGFYQGVTEPADGVRKAWETLDVKEALAGVFVEGAAAEAGFSTIERMWARPGIDINGISGGNVSPNERSVLPASAFARLSFRLVGDQDPHRIRNIFRDFVKARVPSGCRVEFEGEGGSSAVTVNDDSPYLRATARALDAEWPEPTLIKGTGGAIPLVGMLTDQLGVDCIVTGFILGDDAIHAPNERYDLERLHKGIRSWVRILCEVISIPPGAAGQENRHV